MSLLSFFSRFLLILQLPSLLQKILFIGTIFSFLTFKSSICNFLKYSSCLCMMCMVYLMKYCENTVFSLEWYTTSNLLCFCTRSLQLRLTLCNLMDHSPPDFSVHGILQARMVEWVPSPGIFLTQELNLCLLHLLHWQAGSLPLAPLGKA